MSNIFKEDIRLMLGKLTKMIGDNDSINESILSSIYNDFDNLNTIDQYVIREYLSDCINEIMESRQTQIEKFKTVKSESVITSECRIVPGNDGKFYVYDGNEIIGSYDNEVDARNFCQAQQKNTLVSADEEFNEELNETKMNDSENTDELFNELENLDNENDIDNSPEIDELKEVLEDAENILSILDSNIKTTTDLDTVAKMIVHEDAIMVKKEDLEEADPADSDISDKVKNFRDFLDQIELESIDLINKNSPDSDNETEDVATETEKEIEDIEKEVENENEKEIITEDTNFDNNAKAIVDEKEDIVNVETLEKEPSEDAPNSGAIAKALEEFDEEFEFIDVDDMEDVENIMECPECSDDVLINESVESPVETIEEIDNLLDELLNAINRENISDELTEEILEIKGEIQENLDKLDVSIEESDLSTDMEIIDEVPIEEVEGDPIEELVEDSPTKEKEEKVVAESEVVEEISEKELHEVDSPDGTETAKEAVVAGKTKKSKKVKKDDTKTKDTKNKKSK